mmetsp:Transcript_34427/g.51601  ORF Transcript_34427/g.51601 Transcript_34427/m.51601 type:complete len:176 (+) Transcript_34427:19-546(+)|eukprot:scaffold1520_cov91-Skeletonema_dohrnii-CCMP3373.AAC.1
MTMPDLIEDFPHQNSHHRAVQFAGSSQMCIVQRHEDYGYGNENDNVVAVARHELWYTKPEYASMKLAVKEDVLEVRARELAGVPFNYAGNDDDDDASAGEESSSSSVCCVGIEHLLTSFCRLQVKTCRARCTQAVLVEQSRIEASETDIALASCVQTRKAVLRARKLGKLHLDSI